jgi:hypothetical protein
MVKGPDASTFVTVQALWSTWKGSCGTKCCTVDVGCRLYKDDPQPLPSSFTSTSYQQFYTRSTSDTNLSSQCKLLRTPREYFHTTRAGHHTSPYRSRHVAHTAPLYPVTTSRTPSTRPPAPPPRRATRRSPRTPTPPSEPVPPPPRTPWVTRWTSPSTVHPLS